MPCFDKITTYPQAIFLFEILGISTSPSVKALKYNPVPPTTIGVKSFFHKCLIFFIVI